MSDSILLMCYNFMGIVVIWFIGECLAYFLFPRLSKRYPNKKGKEAQENPIADTSTSHEEERKSRKNAVVKGVIERLCLLLSLIVGFPQMLIAFGALKVGTKLGEESQVSNDYYLVGNLVSIILVFSVYLICLKVGLIDICPCS